MSRPMLKQDSISSHSLQSFESPTSHQSLSRLESSLKTKRLLSDDSITNLIKSLEIQIQRIDMNFTLNFTSGDPVTHILTTVKSAVDEIINTKEKLKMNSFISATEHDKTQYYHDPNTKIAAEKLAAASKQLKHFERLLKKKEKMIVDKEKDLNKQKEIIEKSKEQLEVTKQRLDIVQEKSSVIDKYSSFGADSEKVAALVSRLALEKEQIEEQKRDIALHMRELEETIERLEKEKNEVNDLIEENHRVLQVLEKEKADSETTKLFIERQKNEILDIKKGNESLLETVGKERANIKFEGEKLLRQKIELDSKMVFFNREKSELAKALAAFELEKGKLLQEKELVQQIKNKMNEERDSLKEEYNSLEEIKAQIHAQGQMEFTSKEKALMQREEDLDRSLIDLKAQIEGFNRQILLRENDLNSREEIIIEKEAKIKLCLTNLKLIEMSLVESKSQCEETQQILIPEIEKCYTSLQAILENSKKLMISADKIAQKACSLNKPTKGEKNEDEYLRSSEESYWPKSPRVEFQREDIRLQSIFTEMQEKLAELSIKEEDLKMQEASNQATSDLLEKNLLDLEKQKKQFELDTIAEKERLRRNFLQLESSLKMVKEKENDLVVLKAQLDEREKLLRMWEDNCKYEMDN